MKAKSDHYKKYASTQTANKLQASVAMAIDKSAAHKELYLKYNELCEENGIKKYKLLFDLMQEALLKKGKIKERLIDPIPFVVEMFGGKDVGK